MAMITMGKSQLVLCLLALIGLGLGRVLHQAGPYWMGLRGGSAAAQSHAFSLMAIALVVFGIGALSTLAFVALAIGWHISQRSTGRQIAASLMLAALLAMAWCTALCTMRAGNRYFLAGYRVFMQQGGNVPAIEKWCDNITHPDGSITADQWPPEVSRLRPSDVLVETIDGKCSVRVLCGGGFMHWGLDVRAARGTSADDSGEERLPIDKRSYVWVESQ